MQSDPSLIEHFFFNLLNSLTHGSVWPCSHWFDAQSIKPRFSVFKVYHSWDVDGFNKS